MKIREDVTKKHEDDSKIQSLAESLKTCILSKKIEEKLKTM